MDPVGAFCDEEWDSLSKFFSSEDSDLMLHMHGSELFTNQANFLHNAEENVDAGVYDTVFFTFDHTLDTTNFHYVHQENNNSSTEIDKVRFSNQENVVNFLDQSSHFCTIDCKNDHNFPVRFPEDHAMDDILFIKEETGSVKIGKTKSQPSEIGDSVKETLEKKFPNKKSRVYRSEDDFNGGENSESKGSASVISKGKARGSTGSATDSQSLYARRRRERVNERLRILQNLVPNGTKVDISTMLEEAVHYVKFLQLQIKLLSSDDTWMYAPIAYTYLRN